MKNNIISRSVVGGRYLVSTVDLGLLDDGSRPYETMVFACDSAGTILKWLGVCYRSATPEAAIAMHNRTVEKWAAK
jgi:hypothetical protein